MFYSSVFRQGTLLLLILFLVTGSQFKITAFTEAASDTGAKIQNLPLQIHPENSRYFEYKGLPMVLFGHQGGLRSVPVPDEVSPEALARVSRAGNHFYMTVHPTWVRADFKKLYEWLNNESNWTRVREVCQAAHNKDVIVHLFFWSYKWNYEGQDWTGSDMIWPDPTHDGNEVLEGVTRRDLHLLAIEKAVEATWYLPNVVYNFMWEYNVRRHADVKGDFHRWWVDQVKMAGQKLDPNRNPLFSIKYGSKHPSESNADFVVEEDGNGFFYRHPHTQVLEYGVPAVFISSDFVFADNPFSGWDEVPYDPRVWKRKQNSDYQITPEQLRAMVTEGFHPAETWKSADESTLKYYLQARWYLENLPTWPNEPGKNVSEAKMPRYTPSERPRLLNPNRFTNGRNGEKYAVIYQHPDGLPPSQAEVWIDVNNDGRFSPDPISGERFTMKAHGTDYKKGVLFTVSAPGNRPFVFRFADYNWNPPAPGGLVPEGVEGISYDHWK
jgi:hypothetical protein